MGTSTIAQGDSYVNDTGGTVTNVSSGDVNRITVTNGSTTPVISAPDTPVYVGITLTTGTVANAPSGSTDIVNKAYVDAFVMGLTRLPNTRLASISNIIGVYSNGTAGVGATITVTATGNLTVDGKAVNLNDVLLINNQTLGLQNGIYIATNPGSLGVSAILTRATYFDTSAEMTEDSYTIITEGDTLAGTMWLFNTSQPITVGVTSLSFEDFGALGTMAHQNANAVDITGGTIDGTVIGGITPAAGTFTALRANTSLTVQTINPIDNTGTGDVFTLPYGVTLTQYSSSATNLQGINLLEIETYLATGGSRSIKTRVVTAAGAVTVQAFTDDVVIVNKTVGAATTVNLPIIPVAGDTYFIKDGKGDAATNNITIATTDGKTIDGASTYIMNTNFEAQRVIYNGTQWNIL